MAGNVVRFMMDFPFHFRNIETYEDRKAVEKVIYDFIGNDDIGQELIK